MSQDDHTEKFLSSQVEKSEKAVKIYNETKQALQTEERFVNLFKSYEPESVNRFVEYYAGIKAHWYEHGKEWAAYLRRKDNRWRTAAISYLKAIFDKKLFNLKCRWVAGEMDLPGIKISSDFRLWSHDPNLASGFIEPVTDEELSCYIDYMKWAEETNLDEDGDMDVLPAFIALDSYHRHRVLTIDDEPEKFCAWYNYYDERFGTAGLATLPCLRSELEEDYHDIWSVEIYKKQLSEEVQKNFHHMDRRQRKELKEDAVKREAYYAERNRRYEEQEKTMPKYEHMSLYDREKMKKLVALIETPEVQKYYHATRRWHDQHARHDSIDSAVYNLREVKEWIPVNSHDDYRDAIREAYDSYTQKKILETLPFVFEEYKECMAAKKPFQWTDETSAPRGNDFGDRILASRKWKGEPENFDFLKKENLPKEI